MKLIEIAEKLVSFNTVSQRSSTREIADFISNYCESKGFKIEQYPYRNNNDGLEKVNVVARKGGQKSKLAFSGHMDTVPFNGTDWNTDPLKLTLINKKYFGMGIADMKLFIAIAMKAGEAIEESELKYPFALCFTSDEEVGCLGARQLIRQDKIHVADSIIIGEPTEMTPLNLHKGYMFIRIKLRGITGHASDPRNGKSVVHLVLVPVLQKLFLFKEKLKKITDRRFNPPYPTMNIGVVTTDNEETNKKSSKNSISNFCKIELEIRPVPGQDAKELYFILEQMLTDTVRDINDVEIQIEHGRIPTPPMETSDEKKIAQLVIKVSRKTMMSVCFNTEGGVFNKNGAKTIIWGPASIKQAHKPKEFANARYFKQEITDKYVRVIREFCCERR